MIDILVSIAAVFSIFCLGMMLWNMWAIRCNNLTYKHRLFIINWAYSRGKQHLLAENRYDLYDAHLEALMWFRDPRRLYPAELQDAFDEMPR